MTNSLEMAKVIEEQAKNYEYIYEVKVHGRFTDEKLISIRKGSFIKGQYFGPFYCQVKKYLNRNTKLIVKNKNNKMRDIKMIFQKNDLLISKIKRVKYGPYTQGILKQGDFFQTEFEPNLHKKFFLHRRNKIKESKKMIEYKVKMISDLKSKDDDILKLNKINLVQEFIENKKQEEIKKLQ